MNQLSTLPPAVDTLSSLTALKLGHNRLSELPSPIVTLLELKSLQVETYVAHAVHGVLRVGTWRCVLLVP